MSKKASSTEDSTQNELINESSENTELESTQEIVSVSNVVSKPVVTIKANKTGKMGVYKFLSLYPQDYYIETLLILNYPNSFFTKEEWFERIQELLETPITN